MTAAILVLVAATLILTSLGSFYFIRHAAVTTAEQELAGQARATSEFIASNPDITRPQARRLLGQITRTGAFADTGVVALYPDGTIRGRLPSGLTTQQIDVPVLQQGKQTTGHTGGLLAFSAVPTPLERVKGFVPVLVITRQIQNPVNGLRYFALVGAVVLLVAALVAAGLARRLTRPLLAAVRTTRRIASGDLDATVPLERHADPEFAQLADAINTMGADLVRAREQERQFLLSVSHELRTPLTSIRGYADAIVDGAADDPSAAAAVIGTEAGRLERLVQDLLDLARIDADRFSLAIGTIDASAVVAQVADGFRPRAADLGLELSVVPADTQPLWVEADPDRLGQVVANLVENASSFADHHIVIGTGYAGGSPAMWVADDGPGIPPDQLSRVFERHFVSDRVSGRRAGSGLGLAIVSELAAAMGGAVRAESPVSEGRGTRMVVSLRPAAAPQAVPPHSEPAPPAAPPAPSATGAQADHAGLTARPGQD